VTAAGITGQLTVHAEGGGVTVSRAPTAAIDSGGGPVYAAGITGPLTVNAEGGGVTVTGAGATEIESGGGPVTASTISGPLGVTAEGGGVEVSGVTGTLNVDTGGGPLSATSLTSPSATVTATAAASPSTSSPRRPRCASTPGAATRRCPCPAARTRLTANTGGSVESVLVAISPGAASTISVTTDGGNLQIGVHAPSGASVSQSDDRAPG
jgi:hypothetical protein